jgi:hypothetical protein
MNKFTLDYKDFTIRWNDHPKYSSEKIIEDDLIEVIVQKLEMLLFTNTYEIIGDDGFDMGINLEYYLWQTKVNKGFIKQKIEAQINKYVPELNTIGYDLDIKIFEGTFKDILYLDFIIKGYNIEFQFN